MDRQEPRGRARLAASIVLVVLIGASLVGVVYLGTNSAPSRTRTSTASSQGALSSSVSISVGTANDTFLTSCSVTGVGGFALRVVSDSTGSPISGESISAVDRLGCDAETQVVYIDEFSAEGGGWLAPAFPSKATPGGQLMFAVTYQGRTYNFTTEVPPIGTACVTLHVPSGSMTTATVMNGEGSYCSQATTTTQTALQGYYAINGLTCPDPSYTSAHEAALITGITESPRFQAATNGSLFVLGNFENITDRIQTINGTATHLPDVLELVFYGYGPGTTCVRGSGDYIDLDVQVPIEDGAYDVTDMQIHAGNGPF